MSAPADFDAIVVGGGHNGLACAAYLARAGRRVIVLERRGLVGGAAVSEELHPGFTYSVCSYVVSLLRPWIIRDLELARHGLELIPLECSFSPYLDGRSLARWDDARRTHDEIAAFSKRDAERYPLYGQRMAELAAFVAPLIDELAPDPATTSTAQLADALSHWRRFRALPARQRTLFMRLMTASAADFLDEHFESDELKAPMSVSGIIGTMQGVRSPGTAYVLLHHYMGEIDGHYRAWGFARGGTGAVSEALASAARFHGAVIRTDCDVAGLLFEGDEACGVHLANGDELRARSVISGLDPRRTFHGLVGRERLPNEINAKLDRFRYRGSSGKVNLALDRLPNFTSRPGDGPHLAGDIAIAPSVDALELAFDEAKAGRWSSRPYINVVIPSLSDPTVAPDGKHVMSCFVQYAPYELAEGPDAWPAQRDAFGDNVIATLEQYAPGLSQTILHQQVLTPWDLEREFGLSEGNIFHGELSLEQLAFLRPMAGQSQHATPIPKLWLASSGAHPGGGIMGAPGALCARRMLAGGAL